MKIFLGWLVISFVVFIITYIATENFGLSLLFGFLWPIGIIYLILTFIAWG